MSGKEEWGRQQAERQNFIPVQWAIQPSRHLDWEVEPEACLPHSEAKKPPQAKTKTPSHQAIIRRHTHISLKFGLYFLQNELKIRNLKMGEEKKKNRIFTCKSLTILIQPI